MPSLLDWLACAARGAREPAALAARAAGDGLLERVAAVGAAGHVLDFDDTYAPGLAHLSAATAPAALVLGAELGAGVGAVLDAYAAGFEAMGAFARACHPALYAGGWHPTAVCGSAGAAVAAARLLGLGRERSATALALALLRAGGLRAAFGSDGKALQVGLAAAAGVHAARLAQAGARADADAVAGRRAGFAQAFGVAAGAADPDALLGARGAIGENWVKAYPCCLQTHGAIDAALAAGDAPPRGTAIAVTVHPVSRQAAALDAVRDGLEAKFSIPYLTATRCCTAPPPSRRLRRSTRRLPRSLRGSRCARTPRSNPTRRCSHSMAGPPRTSSRRSAAPPTRSAPGRCRRRSAPSSAAPGARRARSDRGR